MGLLEVVPASRFSSVQLAALFTRGYEGYFTPVSIDASEFEHMALGGDFDLGASRVVRLDGAPVAFAFLGVRGTRGWIGGMGVAAEARGRGLGRRVMEAVLESARRLGLHHVDLEVLVQNERAALLYEQLGFRDRRRFEVWVREPAAASPPTAAPGDDGVEPVVLEVEECLALYPSYHSDRAPWQRALETLRHGAGRLAAMGVRGSNGIRGWVLHRVAAGRLSLADLAVAPGESWTPVERVLERLIAAHPASTMLLVNLPEGDPLAPVLERLGARVRFRQREMTLVLGGSGAAS